MQKRIKISLTRNCATLKTKSHRRAELSRMPPREVGIAWLGQGERKIPRYLMYAFSSPLISLSLIAKNTMSDRESCGTPLCISYAAVNRGVDINFP